MDRELSLADYLSVLRRRWLYIVVSAALFGALGYYQASREPTLYRSSSTVLVTAGEGSNIVAPGTVTNFTFSNALANEALYAQGVDVTRAVFERLGRPAIVSVSASEDADVLTIVAIDEDAELAAETANVYAEVFIEQRRRVLVEEYAATGETVQAQLDEIDAALADLASDSPEQSTLQRRRDTLVFNLQELSLASQLSGGTRAAVLFQAQPAGAPFQPAPRRNTTLGVVLGLIVGVGLAFAREFLDDRIRTPEDLELIDRRLVPLAAIPTSKIDEKQLSIASIGDPDGLEAECYRRLRSAVAFLSATGDTRVIQVTSASQGEGKSTTVANLAVALARAGKRVVVVDADLRRPRQHRLFGTRETPGLSDVLVGSHEADEVATRPLEDTTLAVIPAGSSAPHPAELLSLGVSGQLLDLLEASADVVLVDSPPLLAVSDGLAVAQIVDGTIIVVHGRRTRAKDVRAALAALERVDANVLGAVINRIKAPDGAYYDDYLTARPTVVAPRRANDSPMTFDTGDGPTRRRPTSPDPGGQAPPTRVRAAGRRPAAQPAARGNELNDVLTALWDRAATIPVTPPPPSLPFGEARSMEG